MSSKIILYFSTERRSFNTNFVGIGILSIPSIPAVLRNEKFWLRVYLSKYQYMFNWIEWKLVQFTGFVKDWDCMIIQHFRQRAKLLTMWSQYLFWTLGLPTMLM